MDVELDIHSDLSSRLPTDPNDLFSNKFVIFKIRADTVKFKSQTCVQLNFMVNNDQIVVLRAINNHLNKIKNSTTDLTHNVVSWNEQLDSLDQHKQLAIQLLGQAYLSHNLAL